jgi:hypothetical protein
MEYVYCGPSCSCLEFTVVGARTYCRNHLIFSVGTTVQHDAVRKIVTVETDDAAVNRDDA